MKYEPHAYYFEVVHLLFKVFFAGVLLFCGPLVFSKPRLVSALARDSAVYVPPCPPHVLQCVPLLVVGSPGALPLCPLPACPFPSLHAIY